MSDEAIPCGHERAGTGYDAGACAHERQGRAAGDAREALALFDRMMGASILTDVEYEVLRRKKPKGSAAVRAKIIREIEEDLQRQLAGEWDATADEVLDELLRGIEAGSGALTDDEVRQMLDRAAVAMGPQGFVPRIVDEVRASLAEAYNFGRVTFVRSPTYNLVDVAAKDFLTQNTTYWIGEHYGAEVGPRIAESVRTTIIEQGLGRREAGKALKEIFEAEVGPRSDAYWTGTAASAATRSRNMGHVESFVEGGFTELEFVAVMDERTSDICRMMNGKIFRVEWAVKQRDAMLAATTPEEARAAAPWPKTDKDSMELLRSLTPEQLAASGVLSPPLHFYCRSVLVVR